MGWNARPISLQVGTPYQSRNSLTGLLDYSLVQWGKGAEA